MQTNRIRLVEVENGNIINCRKEGHAWCIRRAAMQENGTKVLPLQNSANHRYYRGSKIRLTIITKQEQSNLPTFGDV